MPDFTYTARDQAGKSVAGRLAAADKQEALSLLGELRLFPVKVEPARGSALAVFSQERRVRSSQLVNFYSQLADLLNSGVPLLRSLKLIEDQASHPVLKDVVADIREQVADGKRLAQAMGRHPQTFSTLVLSLVEAGEEGSFLEDALKRLALFVQHQNELKGKVIGAMIYPGFVASASVIIATVVLVFFVPMFESIFERMEKQRGLPWATETLMSISETLQSYWPLLLILIVAGCWLLARALKTDRGREIIDSLLIREWKIGPVKFGLAGIFRNLAVARFCRVLGTLLQNGVPMLRAISISRKASGNRVIEQAIEEASGFVSSGKSLAGPLRQSSHFSKDVVEMIAVAEESNQLERVLVEVADQLERKVQTRLMTMVQLLEPVMLLLLASFVLFILLALLLPILQTSMMV